MRLMSGGGRSALLVCLVLAASSALASACSAGGGGARPSPSSAASPGAAYALGSNNPAEGDCTTDTSEAATSVGSVVFSFTSTTFRAEIRLQAGTPNTTYAVFMQQVPGSCPQNTANGGVVTSDATGHAQATRTVSRVPGATTFFVQLVPTGSSAPSYTSDRVNGE